MTYAPDIESLLGGNVVPIRPESPLDRPLKATGWADSAATKKYPVTRSLRQWRNAIKRTSAKRKDLLPWLKLATFGDTVNPENPKAGCLRHDGNVLAVSGIEGDYDGEILPIDVLADKIEAAGISALLHESPSHKPDAPRSRVLCALSREYAPEERAALVARLNGVLGGVLTVESFTLSQSYYFGRDESNSSRIPPRVILVGGDYIDLRADLDAGRPATKGEAAKPDGKVNRSNVLNGIAASCVKRRLSFEDFKREAKANPIAWDHVQRDKKGRPRTPAMQERTLKRAWDWAKSEVKPYFGGEDMAGGGDIENGRAFAARHTGEFLHVAGAWLRWDGARWAPCSRGEHVQAAKALAGELMAVAAREHAERGSDATKARLSRAKATYEDRRKLASMLAMAETEPTLVATVDQFDRDPWIMGVSNGLLDLKTGKLIPPRPDQFVRLRAGVAFDPEARCPKWLAFLERVLPDHDVRAFLRRAAGWTLTGTVDEERFFFLHGSGANGKTTFCEVMGALMGDYGVTLEAQHLMSLKVGGKDPELTKGRLFAKRFAMANETKQGSLWNDALMKELSAKDTMTGRVHYENAINFAPSHKLWIRGNHIPGVLDTSDGFWRRMTPIEFGESIPPKERIDDLDKQIIRRELPGVLIWALQGLASWREGGLAVPTVVVAETAEYRDDSDILGRWKREHLIKDSTERVTVDAAYRSYVGFCRDEGVTAPSKIGFGRLMASRRIKANTGGAKGKQFIGYTLKEARNERV